MKFHLVLVTIFLCTLTMSVSAQNSHWSFNSGDNVPVHSVLNFTTGFDTALLVRETDTPQHSASQTLTTAKLDGQTTNALHVFLSDLADHDTLRAPDYSISPASSDDAKTILWARGDIHTPKLMVEWDERDGTRWIATFPITEQWQRIVLSPKDFAPWLVAADRARLGFHPSQAMSFRMGLDVSNTHTAPGLHEYWVAQIGIESPPPAITPVAPLVPLPALSADAVTISLRPADTSVTCQVGDRLQIAGSVTMQNTFDTCLLMADGVVASTRTPSIPTDNYSFAWTPKTPGTHILELRYTTLHAKVTVRRLLVTAEDAPPAVLTGSSVNAGVDTAVAVVGAGPRPFPLARVDFYLDNKPFSVVTAAPFDTTLPIEAITQPGTYPVKFVAYDESGRPFYAHASKIEVPQRIQVTAPRTLTLRNAGDKANLTASVMPGIKVAKVSYSIVHADASHYETLADVTSAPYSADVDLSNRASGDYWVRAIATSAAGNSYEAWAVPLTLTNVPDDERIVQEAKDKAAAEAKVAAMAAENAKKQVEAEIEAKRQEDKYETDVANNTIIAVAGNHISVDLDGDVAKIGDCYLFSLKVTNRTNKAVGPINPDIHFDDFSFSEPLAYDGDPANPFDDNGLPTKYLTDPYHDLVVPANSTKTFRYYVPNFLTSEKSRKPSKISFMGTLRPIVIPLKP